MRGLIHFSFKSCLTCSSDKPSIVDFVFRCSCSACSFIVFFKAFSSFIRFLTSFTTYSNEPFSKEISALISAIHFLTSVFPYVPLYLWMTLNKIFFLFSFGELKIRFKRTCFRSRNFFHHTFKSIINFLFHKRCIIIIQ